MDNVATLLKVSRLVTDGLDLQALLQEAKRQLHEEADYLLAARLRANIDVRVMLERYLHQ